MIEYSEFRVVIYLALFSYECAIHRFHTTFETSYGKKSEIGIIAFDVTIAQYLYPLFLLLLLLLALNSSSRNTYFPFTISAVISIFELIF